MDHYLINFHKTAIKNNLQIAHMNLRNACEYQVELLKLMKKDALSDSDLEDLELQKKAMNQINEDLKSLRDCL